MKAPKLVIIHAAMLCVLAQGCSRRQDVLSSDDLQQARAELSTLVQQYQKEHNDELSKRYAAVDGQLAAVSAKLGEFESRIASLGAAIATAEAHKQEIENLRTEIETLKFDRLTRMLEGIAYLRPGDQGYSTIRFDLGTLTMKLADVSAYANGSRMRLTIGNPLACALNGLEATIEYGSVNEKGYPAEAEPRSKNISIPEKIVGGAFTNVTVVLDGIQPEKFGYVRIKSVTHKGTSMTTSDR